MVYGAFFKADGLSDDEIIANIARELIRIDHAREERLWVDSDENKEIIYQPTATLVIIDVGIIKNENIDIYSSIRMRIYEIIMQLMPENYKIIDIEVPNQQHLVEKKKHVVSFEEPLGNIKFNTDIVDINANTLKKLKDGFMLVHKFAWQKEHFEYKTLDKFFPFTIIGVGKDINNFDKKGNTANYYPWNMYESNDPVVKNNGLLYYRGQRLICIGNLIYNEGYLIMQHGQLRLISIEGDYHWHGDMVRVKIPITFDDVITDFISSLHPYSIGQADIIQVCKEYINDIREKKEPRHKIFKSIKEVKDEKIAIIYC